LPFAFFTRIRSVDAGSEIVSARLVIVSGAFDPLPLLRRRETSGWRKTGAPFSV
jgi:hypothetical protein